MRDIIFKATTHEGYCIKILSELLQYSIKTAYYEIDSTGIRLKMEDTKKHMIFDIQLLSENFFSFELNTDKICFGVNQLNLYTMLKSIKKKDTVTLCIDKNRPLELGIFIEPKEKTKVSCSYIKIYQAHNIQMMSTNSHYTHSYAIQASDYSKTCKEMSKLSRNISVTSCKTGLMFETNTDNIYRKNVTFGSLNETAVEQTFFSEYLANISKISGMSSVIHMYQARDTAMMSRTNIGTLGKMIVYIKTIEQIESADIDEDILEI